MAGRAKGQGQGTTKRVEWIDAAKGLGIIAVAAGHIWTRGLPHQLIYGWHMPLFFLLAGYVFTPRPVMAFTWRQLVGIGLPYVSFLLLLWGFDCFWEVYHGKRPWLGGWDGLARVVYGGTALNGPFTVFWFATCLMVARIIQNLIAQHWPDPLSRGWVIIALASLALGTALPLLTKSSPLGLLTVPAALFLLWAGHALKTARLPAWWWLLAIPAAIATLLWSDMNMKLADYGFPLLSMLGAIAVSLIIFGIARWTPWLAGLGRASLVIMFLHVPIIHYVGAAVPKPAMLFVSLALSFAAYHALGANRLTALLFRGEARR